MDGILIIISSTKRFGPLRLREERWNDDDRIREHSFVLSSRNSNSAIFCLHRSGQTVLFEGCIPCKPLKTGEIEFSLFCDSLFAGSRVRWAEEVNTVFSVPWHEGQ